MKNVALHKQSPFDARPSTADSAASWAAEQECSYDGALCRNVAMMSRCAGM
jgi:hypothetical protein